MSGCDKKFVNDLVLHKYNNVRLAVELSDIEFDPLLEPCCESCLVVHPVLLSLWVP